MPQSPRSKPDLVDEKAKSRVPRTAASALRAKTRVVKFNDFQSTFFPSRPDAGEQEKMTDSADRADS